MKKIYTAPSVEPIRIEPSTLLAASGAESESIMYNDGMKDADAEQYSGRKDWGNTLWEE